MPRMISINTHTLPARATLSLLEDRMPKRFKLSHHQNKKIFRQGANRIHRKNFAGDFVMRGGIRL